MKFKWKVSGARNQLQGCRNWKCQECHWNPIFDISVNPITTRWSDFVHFMTTGSPKFFHLPAFLNRCWTGANKHSLFLENVHKGKMKYTLCMSSLRSFYVNQFYLWVLAGVLHIGYVQGNKHTNKQTKRRPFLCLVVLSFSGRRWTIGPKPLLSSLFIQFKATILLHK